MIAVQSLALAALLLAQANPAPPPPPPVRVIAPSRSIVAPLPPRAMREVEACRRAFYGQDYWPQPPLFRLRDADTTLYLLGSFHVLPSGFEWRSEQLDEIIDRSDTLITETVRSPLTSFGLEPAAIAVPAPATTTLPPLRDRLQGERLAKWVGMAAMGPPSVVKMIDGMPSWRAAVTIDGIAGRTDVLIGSGVESQLERTFRAKKKPHLGLEDGPSVMARVDALPAAVQQRMLDEALDKIGTPRETSAHLATYHRWARGEQAADPSESGMPPELRHILLDARNQAWVPEVERHLQKAGTRLIVVGAAHLRGKGSLLDTLAARGLVAERVSPTGTPKPRPLTAEKPERITDCLFGKPPARVSPAVPPAPPPPASAVSPPPPPGSARPTR